MHVIAAKAVAFGEALQPEFKDYAARVIANAADPRGDPAERRPRHRLRRHRLPHGPRRPAPWGVKGRDAERALERAGLTCNKNAIPFDPEKPFVTSGVRPAPPPAPPAASARPSSPSVGELVLRVVDAPCGLGRRRRCGRRGRGDGRGPQAHRRPPHLPALRPTSRSTQARLRVEQRHRYPQARAGIGSRGLTVVVTRNYQRAAVTRF